MKACAACWILLISFLLVLIAQQSCGRKTIAEPVKSGNPDDDGQIQIYAEGIEEENAREHMHSHPSLRMEDSDPLAHVFLTMGDLKAGKKMPVYIPYAAPSATPKFLTREEADSIPFSLAKLPYLLSLFSLSPDSPQAKAVEYTLTQCGLESKGETKFCATSLESLLNFVTELLGSGTQLKVITTTRLSGSTVLLQNYTFLDEPKEIVAPKIVACHGMPYPYAVLYCHSPDGDNRVFEFSMAAKNGDRVQAAVVCHMDTSHWDKNHVSFKVLNIVPGASHVCHFVSTDSFVWLAAASD